jgi:transposase
MHIKGQSRNQATLFPERLDELISEDNPVRVIDAFVDALDLLALGFGKVESQATGRPPYDPGDLLKLYVYGYMHRTRSTRRLEHECHKNVEVLWLLNRLAPDFKTIANFRVDNHAALGRVCRAFVQFCRTQQLFGGELVAIDGSKFHADNSPDKVARQADLKARLEQVDRRIADWLAALERADAEEPTTVADEAGHTRTALAALETEREGLTARIAQMQAQGLRAQPDTDGDARPMKGSGAGYNVQTAVDDKYRLIADHDVVQDRNDLRQLYRMSRRAQVQLKAEQLTVLADAGYSDGQSLAKCQAHGMCVYVPVQRASNPQGTRYFDKRAFEYQRSDDTYRCPAGERLEKKTKASRKRLYLYTSEACPNCALKVRCTSAKQRWVSRHFEEDVLNEVAERTAANPLMMRRRKGIVEHPFGTLKRRMDGGRFLVRGLQKVKAEMALAVTAYNLTRAINVLGVPRLCQALAA